MSISIYSSRISVQPTAPVDFRVPAGIVGQSIGCWTTPCHWQLYGWLKAHYRAKGGSSPDFYDAPMQLTLDDLGELELDIRGGLIGGACESPSDVSDYYREFDLAFIVKARQVIASGQSVICSTI